MPAKASVNPARHFVRGVSITPDWDDDVASGRIIIEVKRARAPKRREAGTPAAQGLDLDALTPCTHPGQFAVKHYLGSGQG
jgi:hypothetical protein